MHYPHEDVNIERKKAGIAERAVCEKFIKTLARRHVKGRKIKNTCRTATSLACSHGQELGYDHIEKALNRMEEVRTRWPSLCSSASVCTFGESTPKLVVGTL